MYFLLPTIKTVMMIIKNGLFWMVAGLILMVITTSHAQKRCYTYDAAGCRILRDQSCDSTCSKLVVNTNDNGTGSLRKAIECAESGDTIFFAPAVIGQTIVLTSGPIQINKNIHILQDLGSEVTISSGAKTLQINSGLTELQHIFIEAGCQLNYYGTGIRNYGDMILRDVTIIQEDDPTCGAASVYNLGGLIIEGHTKILKQ
jgi:hypothetical protein